jgi:hypothetical protein
MSGPKSVFIYFPFENTEHKLCDPARYTNGITVSRALRKWRSKPQASTASASGSIQYMQTLSTQELCLTDREVVSHRRSSLVEARLTKLQRVLKPHHSSCTKILYKELTSLSSGPGNGEFTCAVIERYCRTGCCSAVIVTFLLAY